MTLVYLVVFACIWHYIYQRPITGIITASGFLGLVLSLAIRSLIMDFFMGIAISIDQPYRLGDFIMLNKERLDGQVIDINWRTTRILTSDNNIIIIPNSMISSTILTNFVQPTSDTEVEMMFSFDFSVPHQDIKRILISSVVAHLDKPGFTKRDVPKVRIKSINDQGIDYKLKYWIDASKIGPGKSKDFVYESIITNLKKASITPSHPKLDAIYAPMAETVLNYRSEEGRINLLRQVDAFEQLEDEYLKMISSKMLLKHYTAGQTLFREGTNGDSMYIVVIGVVKALVAKNGVDVTVGQLTPGQFFGEMSMLTGEPRTATIEAASDLEVYEIRREHITEVFDKQPKSIEIISTVIAQRQLFNDKYLEKYGAVETGNQVQSLARQLWQKITAFKGLLEN